MQARALPEPNRGWRRGPPERQLIPQCVAGDPDACRMLYQRHCASVARVVRSHGIAGVEADDLCQEIFLIVFRHLAGFRGEGRLRAWINRLASREAIRHARRHQTSPVVLRRARGGDHAQNEALQRRYLGQLLASLSPERRQALVLFELEGQLVDEIAARCGCAVNTIWTRIHRARAQLAQLDAETHS